MFWLKNYSQFVRLLPTGLLPGLHWDVSRISEVTTNHCGGVVEGRKIIIITPQVWLLWWSTGHGPVLCQAPAVTASNSTNYQQQIDIEIGKEEGHIEMQTSNNHLDRKHFSSDIYNHWNYVLIIIRNLKSSPHLEALINSQEERESNYFLSTINSQFIHYFIEF